jgi:autotransporter-associated beta strand protein
MAFFSWSRWFRSLHRPQVKPIRKRTWSLSLERLETRLAPATDIWTGLGSTKNWSTAANWSNGVPNAGDDLVFKAGAAQLSTFNDLAAGTTYNSITLQGANYLLDGNSITLGSPMATGNSGFITVNNNLLGEEIRFAIQMGGAGIGGGQQVFTVNAFSSLLISGKLSGNTGVGLSKQGTGTLILGADNSAFNGAITVGQGIMQITNSNALGDTSQGTTVQQNAQLQVNSGGAAGGLLVNEALILNGPGPDKAGALVNVAGSNTWVGNVQLGSDATFGATAGTLLTITGSITNLGSGHNVTKEGTGTVAFAAANNYNGSTTVNNGILQISNGQALGIGDGTPRTGTTVNANFPAQEIGTLQLTGGITVANTLLTLNGPGFSGLGALDNLSKNNVWTGSVILGSLAPNNSDITIRTDGAVATDSLTITGIVEDPNTVNNLNKIGTGLLVFTNSNTYRGVTTIFQGILEITDSQGLGQQNKTNGTSVQNQATLELSVINQFKTVDSVTGTTNTLLVADPLTIWGPGALVGSSRVGALYSASGINIYSGPVTFNSTDGLFTGAAAAAIGVAPDPNPSANTTYFTNDYSLTITGQIIGGDSFASGFPSTPLLQKFGAGHLILPSANDQFLGPTEIVQGWVTIENNDSLGPQFPVNQNDEQTITVDAGAALHLKDVSGTGLTIHQNLTLAGQGFTYPFAQISQQGALENIQGINSVAGNINLQGATAIGVEKVFGASQLVVTGSASDTPPNIYQTVDHTSIFAPVNDENIIMTGSVAGSVSVAYNINPALGAHYNFDVFYGDPSNGGVRVGGVTSVTGTGNFSVAFGPGTADKIDIEATLVSGIDVGWFYKAIVSPSKLGTGGDTKLGSQLLISQGDANYSGAVDVKQGVFLVQNPTSLGSGTTVTVESGAAIALASTIPSTNGGLQSGVQIVGTHLILNGLGNKTLPSGTPVAALSVWSDTSLVATGSDAIVPADSMWRGPITLNTGADVQIGTNSRLTIDGAIDDASNSNPAGSDLIKIGAGELLLSDPSTYRGNTFLGTNGISGNPGFNPDGVNTFFNPTNPQPLVGGVLTIANSQALGATTGGVVVQQGSAMQVQGNITVGGKSLTLVGQGDASAPNTTPSWFQMGPTPINGGATPGAQPVTGRMTGIAVDPLDPNTIYVSTAGGGAWKTQNGGRTWVQIFDAAGVRFAGAIAVAPSSPNVVYIGTGETNQSNTASNPRNAGNVWTGTVNAPNLQGGQSLDQLDSFWGTGVYKSTDGGHTWTLLTDPSLANPNPLIGKGVSKIVVDPLNPSLAYVAVSDLTTNGTTGGAGVWRYNSTTSTWFNLTGIVSDTRGAPPTVGGFPAAVNTPGPDDDFRLSFPSRQADYSDLSIIDITPTNFPVPRPPHSTNTITVDSVLYLALGSPGMGPQPYPVNHWYYGDPKDPAAMNGVYRCMNPDTALNAISQKPIWYVGDGNPLSGGVPTYSNGGGGAYPTDAGNLTSTAFPPPVMVRQGTVKITAVMTNRPQVPTPLNAITLYAMDSRPIDWDSTNPYPFSGTPLFDVQVSNNGGQTWAATGANPAAGISNLSKGFYADSIVTPDGTNVYIGGSDTGSHTNYIQGSTNGGGAWSNLVPDSGGNGPASDVHASAADVDGQVYFGTDGGIWKLQTANGSNTWADLNGNLATTLTESVAVNPSNTDQIFAGSRDTGTAMTSGTQAWTLVDGGDGGLIRIDPNNPNNVYHVKDGALFKSTTGGVAGSWTQIPDPFTTFSASTNSYVLTAANLDFPFVIDSVNPNRLVVGGGFPFGGGGSIAESQNGGSTFVGLNTPFLTEVRALAIATFQGTFAADPAFPLVTDQGPNTYDPDTIYIVGPDPVTGQPDIFVTKNHGTTWQQRNLPANAIPPVTTNTFQATPGSLTTLFAPASIIADLEVDPRNRDKVYAVVNTFAGAPGNPAPGGHVFFSSDAGQHWVDITSNLPDIPVWKLALDPRDGTLYVGTDLGVYVSVNGGVTWQVFGSGLPQVQVRDLFLDQSNNTLTAATYGRGVFQLELNGTLSNAGALSAVSGTTVWTGPIVLSGPTTIGADGTQFLRNGISTAQLNIVGTISDLAGTPPQANTLTKIGLGNVILSGSNTYSGLTDIKQGVLIVNNPQALGANPSTPGNAGLGTVVENGAALQLESSITGEPLTLNGDGPQPGFNGHNTGSLESIANNNTYSGNITLATNVTIGVDSGSTLTITGTIGETPAGTHFNLTKELTGTLILDDLAGNNTYTGATLVYQGALQLESSGALFGSSSTTVLDGAQLQLQTPTTGPNAGQPVVITGETLKLSGTGIFGTGALLDTGGSNTWAGPISLDAAPGFTPVTFPVGVVTFGVANAQDSLFIGGTISEAVEGGSTLAAGIGKVGPGTLVLQKNDTYTGTTYVNTGVVKIQNPGALGGTNTNDIQRVTVFDPSQPPVGTFQLFYNGAPTVAVPSTGSAAQVQAALNNLLASQGVNGTASVTKNVVLLTGGSLTEVLFTIVFQGGLAGVNVQQLVALAAGGATATVSKVADGGVGTLVKSGAALDLDLDPNNTGTPQTVNGEALHINGTGINGTGALDNISGNNTWTGAPITLDTTSAIGVDKGSLTVSGDVKGPATSELDKVGVGALFFPTANDYQGTTVIKNGVIDISDPGALGGALTDEVQTVTLSGATTGSFQLRFKGAQTSPLVVQSTTGASLQAALQGLSTIGAGNVVVTPSGNSTTYTVTFIGTLAGTAEPAMIGTASSGTVIVVKEAQPGGVGGTQVLAGATLALHGGIHLSTEQITLTGNGFGRIGALMSSGGANFVDPNATAVAPDPVPPDSSIILAGNASIGALAGATLTTTQLIRESVTGSQLTKVGSGVAAFSGTLGNTYTGTTFVNDGTLQLNKTGGALAILGDLVVGDSTANAPRSDVAQLQQNNQMPQTSNVTVNGDGLFDVNGKSQTINSLTITDGTAQTGTSGALTLGSGGLTMTGGTLNTDATGQVILGGDVTASSDATGAAVINGNGTLSMGGTARTFNVGHGTAAPKGSDLVVTLPITGPGALGLTKTGAGRLELDADSSTTYTGQTTIKAGDVQVDGKIGDVVLAGGTVSGTGTTATHGTVGSILGTGTGTPSGTISPGDNGPANPIGTLTTTPGSGTETWGSGTTLAVDLDKTGGGPGVGNDVLIVNGNLNLGGTQIPGGGGNNGGAVLAGTTTANVNIGDSFTIIQATGTISGVFQELFNNNVAFVGGEKFFVTYNPHTVVLTRQINLATLTVKSSVNPSVYGQDFVFTATVTPEPGATLPFAASDRVTFTLHLPAGGTVTDIEPVDANGQAKFDANPNGTLPPGAYTLDVAFSGDPNYQSTSQNGISQTIKQADTTTKLTPSPTSTVYGQQLTLTATVAAVSPGAGIPTGSVTFFIDGGTAGGGSQVTVSFNASQGGQVSTSMSNLGVGQHSFTASYSGDINFNASNTQPPPLSVTVSKDTSSIQLSASPVSPAALNQTVTFTATVSTDAPGTAVPTGDIAFSDGTTSLGSSTLALVNGSYVASIQTSTLALGSHTIKAVYAGTALETGNSTTIPYTISKIATNTALVSSTGPNPSVFGQQVTFTATVTASSGVPAGSVTFTADTTTNLGTVNLDSNGQAKVSTSSLSAGSHTILATYGGNSSYQGSSNSLTQAVQYSSATTLTATPNPSAFGSSVTFKATVTPGVGMPAGTPGGTVDFVFDGGPASGGTDSGPQTLVGGQVSYSTSTLSAGSHTVVAQYSGSNLYGTSNSNTVNQAVQGGSTTLLVRTSGTNPTAYSHPVTFQATVNPTAPGAPTPTGSVSFKDGATVLQTVNLPAGSNQVSVTFSALSVGNHTITATYNGDAVTNGSTSGSISQQVTQDTSKTTVVSSVNPSTVGQVVTFTATVSPSPGGVGTPTGTVRFDVDGGQNGGGFSTTAGLTSGQATFTVTALAKGTHTVVVNYSGDSNFTSSVSNPPLNQVVLYATRTALSLSPNPGLYNVPVTLTATVSMAQGSGQVSGTVDFFDTTTSTALGTGTVNGATGQASINFNFTTLGTHHITASYSGDSSFNGSSDAQDEVIRSDSTISLIRTSGGPTTVFSEPVTFQATVAATAPGAPAPTGSVSFFDGDPASGTLLQTVSLPSGQTSVSLTLVTLGVGSGHNITARYNGDPHVGPRTSNPVAQTVNPDPTTASIVSSVNPTVYSQPTTFTATISKTGNATLTPTGPVTFLVDGNSVGTVNLNAGQAQLTLNSIPVGSSHRVDAIYGGSSDGGFAGSQARLQPDQTVNQDGTSTTVTSNINPAGLGQPVTLIATVKAAAPGAGIPTGSVTFVVDGGNANAANGGFEQVRPLDNTGNAQLTVTALAKGNHRVHAIYGGDGNFITSTSSTSPEYIQVIKFATLTSVSTFPNPSTQGDTVYIKAVVSFQNGFGAVTGPVFFYDNGVFVGQSNVGSDGVAWFATSTLNPGQHTLQASYQGDANYAPSGNVAFQTVNAAPVTIFGVVSALPGADFQTAPFTIYGYALDSTGHVAHYNAPARLQINSGPGTFNTGSLTTGAPFQDGTVIFSGLELTKPGTYHLTIFAGNLVSQDIVINAPGRLT